MTLLGHREPDRNGAAEGVEMRLLDFWTTFWTDGMTRVALSGPFCALCRRATRTMTNRTSHSNNSFRPSALSARASRLCAVAKIFWHDSGDAGAKGARGTGQLFAQCQLWGCVGELARDQGAFACLNWFK